MSLSGKTAFISGAGGGIGAAAAVKFAQAGARVIAADVRAEAAEETAHRITAAGGTAVAVAGDIADPDACRAMIEAGSRAFGGLDVLFNNAGIMLADDAGPVDTPLDAWERTLRVNLTGVFLACKFGIPLLEQRGGGAIVNTASVVALVGSAYPQIAYTTTKGGVVAMTREIAMQYGRRGIRCNAICPGPVATEMVKTVLGDEAAWALRRPYLPMGRIGTPEDVANLAAFLASDEASYITGAIYAVDGGISAAYVLRDAP